MSGYIAETGIKNINNYVIMVNSCRSSRVSNTGGGRIERKDKKDGKERKNKENGRIK
jgi:hypothetical protein